jgi:hypothetical protein
LIHFGVILRFCLPPVSKLLITVVYNMYLDVMGTSTVWAEEDMMQTVEWEETECSKFIKNTTTTTHTQSETLLRCVLSVLGVHLKTFYNSELQLTLTFVMALDSTCIFQSVYSPLLANVVVQLVEALLQTERSWVPFHMVSLEIFIDINFPTALWPWGPLSL